LTEAADAGEQISNTPHRSESQGVEGVQGVTGEGDAWDGGEIVFLDTPKSDEVEVSETGSGETRKVLLGLSRQSLLFSFFQSDRWLDSQKTPGERQFVI
jgi:hypothetical protein